MAPPRPPANLLIRRRILDALEVLIQFDNDPDLRPAVRRRYVDLTSSKEFS